MTKAELSARIKVICKRLDQLVESDRQVINPHAKEPVTLSLRELGRYGENFAERERLHKELVALGSEPIED
jgi:hypothetical protein